MYANEVNTKFSLILELFERGLRNSVSKVFDRCRGLKTIPQEPDFIAGLVIDFTPSIYSTLSSIFPSKKISVTGVYCHQKPIVDIGLRKNPELGDVLFVYVFTGGKGIQTVNSLLLQAKVSTSQIEEISTNDMHQLELYLKWPDFTYQRASKLNGQRRSILPKAKHDGAQYLLIDNTERREKLLKFNFRERSFLWCAVPDYRLLRNYALSSELVDFIKFKAGRIIENDPKITKDDWTKMVWEMIDIAKSKASKRKNMGLDEFPRLSSFQSDGFCFVQADSKSIFSDLKNDLSNGDSGKSKIDFYDQENIGVSVIVIEVDEENAG